MDKRNSKTILAISIVTLACLSMLLAVRFWISKTKGQEDTEIKTVVERFVRTVTTMGQPDDIAEHYFHKDNFHITKRLDSCEESKRFVAKRQMKEQSVCRNGNDIRNIYSLFTISYPEEITVTKIEDFEKAKKVTVSVKIAIVSAGLNSTDATSDGKGTITKTIKEFPDIAILVKREGNEWKIQSFRDLNSKLRQLSSLWNVDVNDFLEIVEKPEVMGTFQTDFKNKRLILIKEKE